MRRIKKVAILGSGVMGSRIACHFANIGLEVMLLDIVPREPNDKEKAAGLTLESPAVRNRIVNDSLQTAIKTNPAPLYDAGLQRNIVTGNFDDDLAKIAEYDWVIEVVVENLEIKKSLYEKVDKVRKPGTLITSNTSGIPIKLMAEGRSEDFRKHFCGTHFFNPPRYLRLLEIIAGPDTASEVIEFLMDYGSRYLGKDTVLCKDTPAFIANRVGIYAIMETLKVTQELGLTVEEVDKLTGPVIGRQKSATFRTVDVVGLDVLLKVSGFLTQAVPNDEAKAIFELPELLKKMEAGGMLGEKTKKGFYTKTKGEGGASEILSLNLQTLEYAPQQKAKFATLEMTKTVEALRPRFKMLVAGQDKAGEFYRKTFAGLFAYVSNRVPEIADELYRIDQAVCAGFGWEIGPYEIWDAIGIQKGLEMIKAEGRTPAAWVEKMPAAGKESFYINEGGKRKFYDIASGEYKIIPGTENYILLEPLRKTNVVWQNEGATLFDIGDGILNLEFHTKMNTLGSGPVTGINKAIEIAEKDYRGLVISNEGAHFSAGANLALLLMYAMEQDYDEINMMIRQFQNTMMHVRYSAIPVVVAPHGMALGGGCELTLHADHVQAHAELYMGLVEFGVGLIPAGGGTKEMTLRASDRYLDGDIELNALKNNFLNIGMAKVSTSAAEAAQLGFLRRGDKITLHRNRVLADAKKAAVLMADAGYSQQKQRTDIKVQGRSGLGMVYAGANSMKSGYYISEHDQKISQKLGYIMCGGDLSAPTLVSEQYLLDLEREAFLSLCGERKTLERIQHMLNTGKPLRN